MLLGSQLDWFNVNGFKNLVERYENKKYVINGGMKASILEKFSAGNHV